MPPQGITKRGTRKPLDGHEERIKQLYHNLTFKKLKEIMDEELGQIIPESQYRRKFKELGLGKYRKTSDTDRLSCIFAQMPSGSKVFLRGEQLSQGEVKRIISRGRPDTFMQLNSHQPPTGYAIRAPTPDQSEDYTANIPFLEFQHALRTYVEGLRNEHLLGNTVISPQVLYMQGNTSSSGDEHIAEGWNLLSLSLNDIQALGNTFFANNPRAISTLTTILPSSDTHGFISSDSLASFDLTLVNQFLRRQLLYSIANSFAGIEGFPIWQPFKLLQGVGIQALTQLFRFTRGPTARCLAQNLFKASIENCSHTIVDAILSNEATCIDVNKEIILVNGNLYTPVERASMLQDYETISVLLHHRADVDKTYHPFRLPGSGALGRFVHAQQSYQDESDRISSHAAFRLLADATSTIPFETTRKLIRDKRERDFLYLIKHHVTKCRNFYEGIYGTIVMSQIVDDLSEKGALAIVEALKGLEIPRALLNQATRRGYRDLYRKLVSDCGIRPNNDTLRYAVEGGNTLLFQEILSSKQLPLWPVGHKRINARPMLHGNNAVADLGPNNEIDRFSRLCILKNAWDAAEQENDKTLMDELLKTYHEIADEYGFHDSELSRRIACRVGNYQWAQELFNQFPTVNTGHFEAAIQNDDGHLIDLLLDLGGRVDCHVLTYVAKYGSYSIIRDLLAEKVAPPTTALNAALRRQDEKIVSLLLAAGAEIGGEMKGNGWVSGVPAFSIADLPGSALQVTAEMGDEKWTKYVLSKGADPNDSRALDFAYKKSPVVLGIILTAYKERYSRVVQGFGSSTLILAIENRDAPSIQMLLEDNADPHGPVRKDDQMVSPFGYAIATDDTNHLTMVTAFLNHDCYPSDVVSASSCGFGADSRTNNTTAFLAAIATENIKLVHLLAERQENIVCAPARRSIRHTAMQRAAEMGSFKMVKLLHNMGAQINEPPNRNGGATSLQLAAIGGFGQIVCYLIDHGADVNAPGALKHGMTALVGAASKGRIDIVAILLNKVANRGENGNEQFEKALREAEKNGYYPTYDYIKERWDSQRLEDCSEEQDMMEFVDFGDV